MSIVERTLARPLVASPRRAIHIDLAAHGHAKVRHRLADWESGLRRAVLGVDVVSAVAGIAVGVVGRRMVAGTDAVVLGSTGALYAMLVGAGLVWLLLLLREGAYAPRFLGSGNEEYRAVLRAGVTLVAIVAFVSFAFTLQFSRGVVLLGVPTMTVVSVLGRYGVRRRLAASRGRGESLRAAVLVGDPAAVVDAARRISEDPQTTGLRLAGVCVTDPTDPVLVDDSLAGVPVLGGEADAVAAVDSVAADVVAVASSPSLTGTSLRRLGWALEQRGVDLLVNPGVVEVAGPRLVLRRANGLPMLHVERPVSSGGRYVLKMAADRVVAALALVVLAPVLGLIALLVRRGSPGPAFFTQERVGEGGAVFRMIKFRTMVADAEQLIPDADESAGNEVLFKMARDPRITRLGAILRRFSIDEIPQLVNVVRGEMSLVGPRPPLAKEVDRYESDAVRRLRARPGMTGLWQVSGRSDLSWVDSVRLDLWYVDNWSLALDAQILVRTVRAVLRPNGAY